MWVAENGRYPAVYLELSDRYECWRWESEQGSDEALLRPARERRSHGDDDD